MGKLRYLNLGCGNRFHPEWINVDFISTNEHIISHDLTKNIPFPDQSVDVVYHSHLLEHFPKEMAKIFLRECRRVLRRGGILRVVVPDLERIVWMYISALEEALNGSQEGMNNYEWVMLMMYDQMVRNYSGGEMAEYLYKENLPNEKFILESCGIEAKKLIEYGRQMRNQPECIKSGLGLKELIKKVYRIILNPSRYKELLIRLILGNEYKLLQMGRFRQKGEVHQWMYDRYSLSALLEDSGFVTILRFSAFQSSIPNWTDYKLDTEPDGSVYKPDSLYMEGVKP